MAIKDGRILLDNADSLTNWGSSGGGGWIVTGKHGYRP